MVTMGNLRLAASPLQMRQVKRNRAGRGKTEPNPPVAPYEWFLREPEPLLGLNETTKNRLVRVG